MIVKKENLAGRLQHPFPAKSSSLAAEKYRDLLNDAVATSPRPRRTTSAVATLHRSRSSVRRISAHEMVIPSDKLRRRHASKEIVRRALTPRTRRLTMRWFEFRPTPSRLSVMSLAN